MSGLLPIFAPILGAVALLLPSAPAADDAVPAQDWPLAELTSAPPLLASTEEEGAGPSVLPHSFQPGPWQQVRIEQRLIIRIAPRPGGRDLFADLPDRPRATRFYERKTGNCVPVSGIAGVEIASDERLLLFLRDRRLIGVNLKKACSARDFYSGFYVERNEDGLLCTGRDQLHSRAGANCEISNMRELIADDR